MVKVIGMGPGDGRYALPQAIEALEKSQVLVGFTKQLERFSQSGQIKIDLSSEKGTGIEHGLTLVEEVMNEKQVGIPVSGDPGFHSLLKTINRTRPHWNIEIIPGVTAFQAACAKTGLYWQDFELLSLHAGETEQIDRYLAERSFLGAVILTGGVFNPSETANYLLQIKPELANRKVWLCSDVGEQNESYETCSAAEIRDKQPGCLCMIIITRETV